MQGIMFSEENDMVSDFQIPFDIKLLFEPLTMVEEMLISPIQAIMFVFRLPCSQLFSRGYVANFSQNVNEVCHILPSLSKYLPIFTNCKKKGQENNVKECKVKKNRVFRVLDFLCKNN
jgi:hypothetical protein